MKKNEKKVNGNNLKNGGKTKSALAKKKNREVDILANNIQPFLADTLVFVKKTRVKTWQGAFILAFAAGIAIATVWIFSMRLETGSEAASETALLKLDPATVDLVMDDPDNPNETFDLDIVLDTQENDIVAVRAIVEYNISDFVLDKYDTSSSSFAVLENNECMQANNDNPCQIIKDDPASGKIDITLANPSPGVNSHSATVATLSFHALRPVNALSPNIKISYTSRGDTEDSDVIKDDGSGTDILGAVTNATVSASLTAPELCTNYNYSDWGDCQINNKQTRTVESGIPAGCEGGANPVLEQACVFVPPLCTNYTYNDWGACQPDNTQSRTVKSGIPAGCEGGANPVLVQDCEYKGGPDPCVSFTYNDWGDCQINNKQTRTVKTSTPENCEGGVAPDLEQNCTFVPPACTDYTYNNWGVCQPDNTQSRTVASGIPAGCEGGKVPELNQTCSAPIVDVDDDDDDDKDDKPKDKTKPKFKDMPSFLNKKRGDKIWWKATDNKGVHHYTISFANIKNRKIKQGSFIIPARISPGIYLMTIRAYDEAGNRARKFVTVRVR